MLTPKQKAARMREIRDWLQLGLTLATSVAAVLLFLLYGRTQKLLDLKLGTLNSEIAALNVDITGMTRERTVIELTGLKQQRVQILKTLRSVPLARTGSAKLDFQFTITNTGAVPVEVTYILLEAYSGQVKQGPQSTFVLNSPREQGHVEWKRFFQRVNVIPSRWQRGWFVQSPDPAAKPREVFGVPSGGGTGDIDPGESSQDGIVVVAPQGTDFVGILATAVFNNDDKTAQFFGVVDTVAPRPTETAGAPEQASVPRVP
jgi:hypothetical protein